MRAGVLTIAGVLALGLVVWLFLGDGDPELSDDIAGMGAETTAPTLTGRAASMQVEELGDFAGDSSLKARVVDTEGAPIAGVRVQLRGRYRESLFGPPPSIALAAPPPAVQALMSETSDAEGRVQFDGLDRRALYSLEAQPAPPWCRVSVARHWAGFLETLIVLDRGQGLRVRAVDADGVGLQAWVSASLQSSREERMARDYRSVSNARWVRTPMQTGRDGRLDLGCVPEEPLTFIVFVPGRGIRGGFTARPPFDEEILLPLSVEAGVTIHGTVRDAEGKPVEGAPVLASTIPGAFGAQGADAEMLLRRMQGESDGISVPAGTALMSRTAVDGTYRIEGLPAGSLGSIETWAGGGRPLHHDYSSCVVRPGDVLQADFQLRPALPLRGRVQDADGAPLGDVVVKLISEPGSPTTVSGADGAFQFPSVAEGFQRMVGSSPGLFPDGVTGLHVGPGGPPEAVITMRPAIAISGRVVDGTGATQAGIPVYLYWGPPSLKPLFETLTNESGEFRFDTAPRGQVRLTAAAPGGIFAHKSRSGEQTEPAVLTLRAGNTHGEVRVRVVGATSRRPYRVALAGHGKRHTTATLLDGVAVIRRLKPGTYKAAVLDAFERVIGDGVEVILPAGAKSAEVTLKPPATSSLSGRVTNADGSAAVRRRVTIALPAWQEAAARQSYSRGERQLTAVTDERGHFRVLELPAGTYVASMLGVSPQEVAVPGGPIDLRLPAPIAVAGRILAPDGTPVARGTITFHHRSSLDLDDDDWIDDSEVRLVVRDGRYEGLLHGGAVGLAVTLGDLFDAHGATVQTLTRAIRSYPLDAPEHVIQLEALPQLSISGRVVDDDGVGVARARVGSRGGTGNKYRSVVSDENGAFRLPHLSEGAYKITVKPPNNTPYYTVERYRADAGTEDLTLLLHKGVAVKGRVLGEGGKPIPYRRIRCYWTAHGKRGVTSSGTDNLGHFTLWGVPDGVKADVRVDKGYGRNDMYFPWSKKGMAITEGDLEIQLRRAHLVRGTVDGLVLKDAARCKVVADRRVKTKKGYAWRRLAVGDVSMDGKFRVGPLAAGRVRISVAPPEGYGPGPAVEVEAPATDVTLTVTPEGDGPRRIRGSLIGQDVRNFRVVWIPTATPKYSAATEVDATGTFVIHVHKKAQGPGVLFAQRYNSTLSAFLKSVGHGDEVHRLTLKEGLEVRGRVAGSGGGVTCKGSVWLSVNDEGMFEGLIESDGTFVVSGLPPLTFTLHGDARLLRGDETVKRGSLQVLKAVGAGSSGHVLEFED